ncbi:hypothetical protein [Nostoc favosum]|uniref:Uncharacterized protein n=1 Tax=Nostoc favosum CHAB5714 TaxID=2780399 RepID=A0ABS8IE06_9NOSO|nr:hypothetical protein [Nostoc favosum]MCC5602409.1 hypothetical protein [Nostoc favosum CHAB5714]
MAHCLTALPPRCPIPHAQKLHPASGVEFFIIRNTSATQFDCAHRKLSASPNFSYGVIFTFDFWLTPVF